MFIKCDCFARFEFPTPATPAYTFGAIAPANFPIVRDNGIFENNICFGEIVRVFAFPIIPI